MKKIITAVAGVGILVAGGVALAVARYKRR